MHVSSTRKFQHFPMRPPFALFFKDKYEQKHTFSQFSRPCGRPPTTATGQGRGAPRIHFFRSLNLYIRSWIRSCSHNHCCHDKVQTKFRPILQTNTWDQEIWEKTEILTWKNRKKKSDFSLKNCMFVSTIFQLFTWETSFSQLFMNITGRTF